MRKLFWLTLTLLAITAGGASTAMAQDKLSVRLDFSPWGVQAAMHLAQNKGWFKEAKLDVDIQDGRGSGNTIQLEVRVELDGQPTLDEIWQTDGPGRWWNDAATITVDGGQAVWRYSTRADQL